MCRGVYEKDRENFYLLMQLLFTEHIVCVRQIVPLKFHKNSTSK